VTFGGRKGNPQGRGMFRVLFRTWRFLKNIENLEGIGLERNVGGMPVATLPPEPLSSQDLDDLQSALRDLRMDEEMYLILPNGLTIAPYSGSINVTPLSLVINRKQQEILQLGFAQFIKLGMNQVGTQALVKGSQDFFVLGLEAIQQNMLESWNSQLVPFLFQFNEFSFPGMSGFPKIIWHQPGKTDVNSVLDAYNKAIGAKVMTPLRQDEEFFRGELDLTDLPDGVGEEVRGEAAAPVQPPAPEFHAEMDGDIEYHPGHPDQSVHDPKGGRGVSGGGVGLIPDKDAPAGSYVTAVVDRGRATERHYVLAVSPTGKYGSGNGLKLKVGGDTQGDIQHRSLIEFFVTANTLPLNSALTPGATALFYADGNPHVTRLAVNQ